MSQEVISIRNRIVSLALSSSRRLRIANNDLERSNLLAALSLLSIASSVVETNPSDARLLHSQARQLSAIQGQEDDGKN